LLVGASRERTNSEQNQSTGGQPRAWPAIQFDPADMTRREQKLRGHWFLVARLRRGRVPR
jgi:hypothetical protein